MNDEINNTYCVYEHISLDTNKKYIGITGINPLSRWNNGYGYISNEKFYKDIVKYGWNRFEHNIIKDNLSHKDAVQLETDLIKKYNCVDDGYNNSYSGVGNVLNFDYYDFIPKHNTYYDYNPSNKYFCKIPNSFIRENINKKYNLNRIFYIVWIYIDRHKNLENISHISIGEILKSCSYKCTKHKPGIYREIIKSLLFLKESNYIDFDMVLNDISYDTLIKIKIIENNFNINTNYTIIYGHDIDYILLSDTNQNKESMLLAFLYISSYIGLRSQTRSDNPAAFYKSIDNMAKDLSMAKKTINQCIDYLTRDNNSLLRKKETGIYIDSKTNKPKTAPNIYVLNKDGYKQEIEWALQKMLDIYKTDKFITKMENI